jgi:hypothetical protein
MAGRTLDEAEMHELREIFGDSVALERVRITRDDPMSFVAPKTIRDTVHLRSDWGLFQGNGMALSNRGRSILVHEVAHVWQYQNGGLAYIPASLWAQHLSFLRSGSRGGAYRWERAARAELPWARWNPEQQAQGIQDLRDARLRLAAGRPKEGDLRRVARLSPLLEELRAGRGAPRLFGGG